MFVVPVAITVIIPAAVTIAIIVAVTITITVAVMVAIPVILLSPVPAVHSIPSLGIEFEIDRASLQVVEFLDLTVPAAHANQKIFYLVRVGIDAQHKTRNLKVQNAVLHQALHTRRNVNPPSAHSPSRGHQLAALGQSGPCSQQNIGQPTKNRQRKS